MGMKTLHKLVVLVAASWVRWAVVEVEERRISRWQKTNLQFLGLNGVKGYIATLFCSGTVKPASITHVLIELGLQ